MSDTLYFESIRISKDWFDIGENTAIKDKDKGTLIAIRFIAFWIAFNGFYAKYAHGDNELTAHQIERLVDKRYDSIKGIIDYDNSPECKVFRSAPVFRGHSSPDNLTNYRNVRIRDYATSLQKPIENYQRFVNARNDEKDRLKGLLLTIMVVRNNLFHGQKTTEPERNFQLVCSAQIILKKVVEALLNANEQIL